MTKKELAQNVSDLTGVPESATVKVINTAMDSIATALQRRDSIVLPGFGTFSVAHRKAKQVRNIKTGELMDVPSRNIPSFKPGKSLKDAVR